MVSDYGVGEHKSRWALANGSLEHKACDLRLFECEVLLSK